MSIFVDSQAPVSLAPASSVDIPPGALLFYDVIPSKAVSRCSVLSCAAEAEGHARLPDAFTLSEFRLWLTFDPRTNNRGQHNGLDLRSLCIITKVADVLDDTRVGAWVRLVAQRLVHLSTGLADPIDDGTSDDKAAAILAMLPDHVQSQVFAAALTVNSQCSHRSTLKSLLAWMPQSTHRALLAETITPTKTLSADLTYPSLPLLKALAELPAAPPSVLSLSLGSTEFEFSSGWPPQGLASALAHHSGLTRLNLGWPCTSPEEFADLAPALKLLTAMRSLEIGTEHRPILNESLSSLQALLHSMALLEELTLSVEHDHPVNSLQRPSDSSCDDVPETCHHCLVRTLSAATSLTSLTIDVYVDVLKSKQPLQGHSLLALPHLSSLHIQVDSCVWASVFLSKLNAPLTSLTFGDGTNGQRVFDNGEVDDFVSGLAQFPCLSSLRVLPAWSDMWAERAQSMLLIGESRELRPLQHLHTLNISPKPSHLHAAAPRLITAFPGLSTLEIRLRHELSGCESSGVRASRWASTVTDISSLPLQHMSLVLEEGGITGPSLSDLVPLAALTSLSLSGHEDLEASGSPEAGVSALSQMSQLQHLRLHCRLGDAETPEGSSRWQRLLPGLAAFSGLTKLAIVGQQVPAEALAAGGVATAWPALRHLTIAVEWPCLMRELRDLVLVAITLPRLEALVVMQDDDYDGRAREKREVIEGDCGMTRAERLQQAAKRAGVALSFEDVTSRWTGFCGDA